MINEPWKPDNSEVPKVPECKKCGYNLAGPDLDFCTNCESVKNNDVPNFLK